MKQTFFPVAAAALLSVTVLLADTATVAAQTPTPALTVPTLNAPPPSGAVTLLSGKPEEMSAFWYKRYTKDPADWTVDSSGVATPKNADMTSRQEFGDCYVHAEFRFQLDAKGKAIGTHGGNSGVALQGRYEIQIFDSYGKTPDKQNAGSFYSQKAARVIASKKPGEWETYDIVFRAPRFGPDRMVTEQARATVFQNGVLVQNNEAFNGMTGIQYSEYKTMTPTGPIILQGNHDPIQFRNVWVVPL